MDSGTVLQIIYAMFIMALKICAPLLLTSLIVGLLVSLFQTVTQINDATLAFLPKVVLVAVALWLTFPWLTQEMVSYTTETFRMMENIRR